MEVLVLRTSVVSVDQVKFLKPILDQRAGRGQWNFALDDCDHILRIVSGRMTVNDARQLLAQHGFLCSELED
jgi:hypothetical protein